MPSRLQLPQVTLCAADTRTPALAAQSLLRSMAQVDFGRVLLFTDDWTPPQPLPGIELVRIPTLQSGADYSQFVMRRLPAHIGTSHVLVTQWDGFVRDASAWSAAFLACDYIGAPWPDQPEGHNVGNGGFSLRSQRFLAAAQDVRITQTHPEDEVLCRTHRALLERDHGVRFAQVALARRFAFENQRPAMPTFGFHGPYNLPLALDEPTLATWVQALPDAFFDTRDARRLARALLLQGMPGTARAVVRRRHAVGRREPSTRLLDVAARVAQALRPGSGSGSTPPAG